MADPLSTATRATKRNLLIASVLAISANAFNVSVDKIPIGGLSLTFDDRLFAFLIFITLTYFLCTFILYYVIDIKNLEETGHQESARKKFDRRQYDFEQSYSHRAARDLEKIVLPKYHLMFYTDGSGTPEYAANTYTVFEAPKLPNGKLDTKVDRADVEHLFLKLEKRQQYWQQKRDSAEIAYNRVASISLMATRSMYATRNYFFDGFLPVILGFVAMAAILGLIDLDWIQKYLPSFRSLHHS